MSGKHGAITICDENGKQKEQEQILTMTVAEVYQLFKNEYLDVTIGKSKFSSLCPMEVKLSSAMPRNVCNCIYCSNVNFILETLHSNTLCIFPSHSDQLVKDCVCEIKNKTFMSSNCDSCKENFDHKFLEAYNKMKQLATEENSNTAMIQMDFADNFTCLYQGEVASAHWKTNSVTFFTVMIRFQKEIIFMVIVSYIKHDKRIVVLMIVLQR